MQNSLMTRLTAVAAAAVVLVLTAVAPAGAVTARGKPVALSGEPPAVGAPAPAFTALDGGFQPVSLADFPGRPLLISVVPSLDTPVCSLQTKRFNEELAELPADLAVMTVSMDLPFAQKRFCGDAGIEGMVVVSDAARREFGTAYGLLMPDRGLLARAVILVDAEGVVRYVQLVPELTQEPDYDAALAAARELAK